MLYQGKVENKQIKQTESVLHSFLSVPKSKSSCRYSEKAIKLEKNRPNLSEISKVYIS